MKRLHISILFLFGWFFVFYNVERLFEQINLASFVYLLAPTLGMLALSVPWLHRLPSAAYLPISIVLVMVIRHFLGYDEKVNAFSLAFTEGFATWVTITLSYHLRSAIEEYQSAAATTIFSHVSERTLPFDKAQADVIREVRRARLFRRPIAVLALDPQVNANTQDLDRFSQELRTEMLQQYVSARAAECLQDGLRPCDILTQTKDHFLALLPELSREDAQDVAETMCNLVESELGIILRVSVSMFPEDEITAIGLIERAEAEIESIRAVASAAAAQVEREKVGANRMHNKSPAVEGARNSKAESFSP